MIRKYIFGSPVQTGAVVEDIPVSKEHPEFGNIVTISPFCWKYTMQRETRIFGLGESVRGMNKRGYLYESWCSDVPRQDEGTKSMYGAHNFIIIKENDSNETFGVFFDTGSRVSFDFGYTDYSEISVSCQDTGVVLYVITADPNRGKESSLNNITRQFRKNIGMSYVPPLWGFGYQQSRWGYKTEDDVRNIVNKHKEYNLPLEAVCLDIDYMEDYKDFSVDKKKFPDLKAFSQELKNDGVRLVPIIDAGVKLLDGYEVYDEGKEKGYFCKKEDGKSDYVAGVWPGRSCFPDFLRSDVRAWFGSKYKNLTDLGIEGFWNDMNEPAMFYSDESLAAAFEKLETFKGKNLDINTFFDFSAVSGSTFNRLDDYQRFYNRAETLEGEQKPHRHDTVHNLFGGKMTQAASEGLKALMPEKRCLLYSRASCIGSHRYGGIWTGDNNARWNHMEQEIKMLPGLNMCGYLYSGADIGGFAEQTTEDLMLRWMALGIFTPLMRNHAAWDAREKELFRFSKEATDGFRSILKLRYALLPYIYSEFVKAAVKSEMFIRPLCFDFENDSRALEIQDQLFVGEGIMIAPVCNQNENGRMVYFPEPMIQVTWKDGSTKCKSIKAGDSYIKMPLDSVVFFVRKGKMVPLFEPVMNTSHMKNDKYDLIGKGKSYELYEDDGFTSDIHLEGRIRVLK